MKYKFLEHTADIKFQAFGKTIEKAFENSAYALQEVMTKKIKIKPVIKKKIEVKGRDKEALLYNFLEEFLFLLDSENFVLSKINKINIKDNLIIINNKNNKSSKDELALKVIKDGNKEQYNHNKEYKLIAEVIGDNAENYNFSNNVKAITYNSMFVKKEGKVYICQVVVDV
jgi:SHS2 domain-containing protein